MNKVWLVLFEDKELIEQTHVFSTREKANDFVLTMSTVNIWDEFSKVSRETDPFDVYEYKDGYGNDIYSIIIEEFEVK